jgi:hypothetical protein
MYIALRSADDPTRRDDVTKTASLDVRRAAPKARRGAAVSVSRETMNP